MSEYCTCATSWDGSCQVHDQIESLKDEIERLRHQFQRECDDTDSLLQGLGLCPSEHRSDGGSLLLGRIKHKVGNVMLDNERLRRDLVEEARRNMEQTGQLVELAEQRRVEIERLRGAMSRCLLSDPPGDCYAFEVVELRAEIERLRSELATWKDAALKASEALGKAQMATANQPTVRVDK